MTAGVRIPALPSVASLMSSDLIAAYRGSDDLTHRAQIGMLPYFAFGTGAVDSTVQAELRSRSINAVTQYGMSTSGTGAANYTAFANALAAAAGKSLYIPGGTYSIDPSPGILSTGGILIYGDGRDDTILSISGNGDFLQRSTSSVLQDLTIDMNGATYAGDACRFANGSGRQIDRGLRIKNLRAGKYACNFAGDGGSQFVSHGCNYHTLATAGVDAAVKVTGTDTAANPRCFFGTNGDGCTVWDLGGCNDFFIFGGFTNNLLFSNSAGVNAFISGLRIGSTSGTVTIDGDGHFIFGCIFADPVVLAAGTTGIKFRSECSGYDITDNGTENEVWQAKRSYTPSWTGSVSNPVLNNGSMSARFSREGKKIFFEVDLTMGSTTTYGSGVWFFSLPRTDLGVSPVTVTGPFWIQTAVGTATLGMVRIEPGLSKASLFFVNAGSAAQVRNNSPYSWAAQDNIRFSGWYYTA